VPLLRRGDYYGGITIGTDRMMRVIEGEPLPEPAQRSPAHDVPGLFTLLPFLFIFALVGGRIFRRMFGRVGGALATGGLVGFLTWLLIGILGLSIGRGSWRSSSRSAAASAAAHRRRQRLYSRRHGRGWAIPADSAAVDSAGAADSAAAGAAEAADSGAAAPRGAGSTWTGIAGSVTSSPPRRAAARVQRAGPRRHRTRRGRVRAAHSGEIRVAIEGALEPGEVWHGKTPRERALEVFAALGVWDTEANNGVLIYVLLADRDVEIVADRGFNGRVPDSEWQAACEDIRREFRAAVIARARLSA